MKPSHPHTDRYTSTPVQHDTVTTNMTPLRRQGVLPEEDLEVCAITLYLEHEEPGVFNFELDAAFPSFERGSLRVRSLTRGSAKELPRDMAGKQVLLLAPVVSEHMRERSDGREDVRV